MSSTPTKKSRAEAVLRERAGQALIDALKKLPEGVGAGMTEGEGIIAAPARGPVRVIRPEVVVRTDTGGLAYRKLTVPGQSALKRADAFDVMEQKSRAYSISRKHDHRPMFTLAQVTAGRAYGAVFERVASGSIKGSDMELEVSGGTGGSAMDCMLEDARRLARMDAKLIGITALRPKQVRDRDQRRAVLMIDLIQKVTVGGLTISGVLAANGWPSKKMSYRALLLKALRGGLDSLHDL